MKNGLIAGFTCVVLSAAVLFGACSSNNNQGSSGFLSSVAWTNDSAAAFNGAYGWNDSALTQTALFSGTSCDNLENSVDITAGFSQDPCALETNDDGTPFTGTIDGTVCNADDDTQVAHTVTCSNGAITDTSQGVAFVTEIDIFRTTNTYNGNLGGRTGADALCAADQPSSVTGTHVHALLSVSASDEVRDMPTNYGVPTGVPIVGPNGTAIADDWADMLDGTIDVSLETAGFPVDALGGRGGTSPDGSLAAEHCSGWTSTTGNGFVIYDDSTTLFANAVNTCSDTVQTYVVCIAY